MEEVELETVYDIVEEEKELTSEENVYVVPPKLFDSVKIIFEWNSEEDDINSPSFYIRISPNTWNQKTNTICSWLVNASEESNGDEETIRCGRIFILFMYVSILYFPFCQLLISPDSPFFTKPV